MAHDVFISYSHLDKPTADAACATLESRGIRCWIAPRDVLPGDEYAAALVNAIHSSRMLVLVFSSGANQSPQVLREVERAVSKGLPILPLRIEDVAPSAAMEYYISSRHWLDALTTPLEQHLVQLADTVTLLLARSPGASPPPAPPQAVKPVPPPIEPPVEPRAEPRAEPRVPPAPPVAAPTPRTAEPVVQPRGVDPARRRVALAGVVMLLLLGIDPGVQRGQAIFGFSNRFLSAASILHLLMLAAGFTAGGLWLRRAEPLRIGTVAGVVFATTFLLSGFAAVAGGESRLFLLFAGLSGLGAGLGLVVVVTTLLRWFPDRRGMIAGVTTAAFGTGSFVSRALLTAFGFAAHAGVGIAALIVVPLAARRLQVPSQARSAGVEVTLREALRSRQWYAIWTLLFLNTAAASLAFMNILSPDGFMEGHFSEAFMALAAAAPCLGRLILPRISDRRGRRQVLLAILLGQAALLATMAASRLGLALSPYLILGVMLLSGGLFGIIPALAADCFGEADLGATYGLLLSAWCLALAIVPTVLVWGMMLTFLSQPQRYILIAGALLVAAAIAFRLWPPGAAPDRPARKIAG